VSASEAGTCKANYNLSSSVFERQVRNGYFRFAFKVLFCRNPSFGERKLANSSLTGFLTDNAVKYKQHTMINFGSKRGNKISNWITEDNSGESGERQPSVGVSASEAGTLEADTLDTCVL